MVVVLCMFGTLCLHMWVTTGSKLFQIHCVHFAFVQNVFSVLQLCIVAKLLEENKIKEHLERKKARGNLISVPAVSTVHTHTHTHDSLWLQHLEVPMSWGSGSQMVDSIWVALEHAYTSLQINDPPNQCLPWPHHFPCLGHQVNPMHILCPFGAGVFSQCCLNDVVL